MATGYRRSCRSLAVAAAAIAALISTPQVSAQVWGTVGSWQMVTATGAMPQGNTWHHAATTAGCFLTLGGDGNGGNATFQYDPVRVQIAGLVNCRPGG